LIYNINIDGEEMIKLQTVELDKVN